MVYATHFCSAGLRDSFIGISWETVSLIDSKSSDGMSLRCPMKGMWVGGLLLISCWDVPVWGSSHSCSRVDELLVLMH